MSISPTNSQIYFNFASIFSQNNGNSNLAAIRTASGSYAQGAFQIRRESTTISDLLDLSPEGLAALNDREKADSKEDTDSTDVATTDNKAVSDTQLSESKAVSEQDRVEMIRVNRNAVLEQVKSLLQTKGIEVDPSQTFDLTANLLDGTLSVTGIADAELASQFNEAISGDQELLQLMQKTRDDLGIADQPNTVARNFTIQFGSMEETPAGSELEYTIDVYVKQAAAMIEGETAESTEATGETAEDQEYHLSYVLSNRISVDTSTMLLDSLDAAKSAEKNAKKDKADEAQDHDDEIDEEEEEVATSEKIPVAPLASDESDEDTSARELFSRFGTYFQSASYVTAGGQGMELSWNFQFSNWNSTGGQGDSSQRLFETWNLGGTMQFAYQDGMSAEEQAAQFESLFNSEMAQIAQGSNGSDWARNFLRQSGLAGLISG